MFCLFRRTDLFIHLLVSVFDLYARFASYKALYPEASCRIFFVGFPSCGYYLFFWGEGGGGADVEYILVLSQHFAD